MDISQYWVGQIPSLPLAIDVRDNDGRAVDLSAYTEHEVILLGSDNEDVDLTGSYINTIRIDEGRLVFYWPEDRSVFTKSGMYLLQLELSGPGKRDFTTAHHIKVRRLGGVR